MTGDVESLVLEQLRAIRATLGDHGLVLAEQSLRLTEISTAVAGLRRDQAHDAEVTAHLAARLDRLRDDVERIKRRLDLTEN